MKNKISPEQINYKGLKVLSILRIDVEDFTTLAYQIFSPPVGTYDSEKFKALLDATEVELAEIQEDVTTLKAMLKQYKKT